jgi:sulfate transport system permease protein
VIFIAGNVPMKSEITSLLIITKLEQYDYAGATALAVVMLSVSFVLLLVINTLQWWLQRRTSRSGRATPPGSAPGAPGAPGRGQGSAPGGASVRSSASAAAGSIPVTTGGAR